MGKKNKVKIKGLELDEIESLDKLGNGMFKIRLKDGFEQELSLDDGESEIIDHHLNRLLNEDGVSKSDAQPSGELPELPTLNRETLERDQAAWTNAELADPNAILFWAADYHIDLFINTYKAIFATPSMFKHYNSQFGDRIPGEGNSPDGRISRNGLTAVVYSKETQKKILEHNYKKRQKVSQNQHFMSNAQRAQCGI